MTRTTTPKAPKRLSTLKQVRLEMAACYGDAREGRIPPGDASRLVYVLGQIAGVIEGEAVEKRIEELERRAGA